MRWRTKGCGRRASVSTTVYWLEGSKIGIVIGFLSPLLAGSRDRFFRPWKFARGQINRPKSPPQSESTSLLNKLATPGSLRRCGLFAFASSGSTSWSDRGTGVDPTHPLTLALARTRTPTRTPNGRKRGCAPLL